MPSFKTIGRCAAELLMIKEMFSSLSNTQGMNRLSIGLLSGGDRVLSQHPFSGTPCDWKFSHRPLYPFPSTAQDISFP